MWKNTIKKAEGDKTGRAVSSEKMKLLPNAYKPLEKAIKELEAIGDNIIDHAIEEARQMDSLGLDANELMYILKVFKEALTGLYSDSESL